MVHFPLLNHLEVINYGLYPGQNRNGHFDLTFDSGLTLILGANGLGKTTLMTMIFRMVAGVYDLNLPAEIGTSDLVAQELNSYARRQFAYRVNDGAQSAHAIITFSVGETRFTVKRRLSDLALVSLSVAGEALSADEKNYHSAVLKASGLGTYADWLLILRTLVFFFEDRRALVWDPGAQRQLLRCLFLDPNSAQEWTKQERAILELDSRMRNLQAAVRKEQKAQTRTAALIRNASLVRSTLNAAEASLAKLEVRYEELENRVEKGDEERQRARLRLLRAQNEHDKAVRELERARLISIEAHLPNADQSMQFLFARLMSDDNCLACGSSGVNIKRESLETALIQHRCLICDSELGDSSNDIVDLGDRRIAELRITVDTTRTHLEQQESDFKATCDQFDLDSKNFTECSSELSDVRDRIRTLVNQLPQEERKTREQKDRLSGIESLISEMRVNLAAEREKFVGALNSYRLEIQGKADAIKEQFTAAAKGFLFEDSGLSWAPIRQIVGQAGGMTPAEYPAFAVELSGSDFIGLQRRSSPNQVSESQREFIDLAFRIALIKVASPEGASTLAVDAPESSLDAVFVDKAAEVLGAFAQSAGGSRLIITSNLGAGELVPRLLREVSVQGSRMKPVVDLFAAGVPTRAMIESKSAYDRYWEELRKKVDG